MAKLVKLSTIKDMVKSKMATDVSDKQDLPKKEVVIMVSKGTIGHNGCVYRGRDNRLYAIVGRNSNLFRII